MDWLDVGLLITFAALLMAGFLRKLRLYRSLIWGGAGLALITALHPRPNNAVGAFLFGGASTSLVLSEIFSVVWWILGAWLLKGILDLIFRRTLFPNDNQPHSRRLFADLIIVVVYVIAFVGIMDTVFKESVSGVFATSGVLAIVLGLALQSTLADVFSGIALNIDHPFRSGDWISLAGDVEGQVIEINWRATRIRTMTNTMVIIPNSVISKAVVTSHRRLLEPYFCTLEIGVDPSAASPLRVIQALKEAAASPVVAAPSSASMAFATGFSDTVVRYQLWFAINDFSRLPFIRSEVVAQVVETMARKGIPIGGPLTDIRISQGSPPAKTEGVHPFKSRPS